MESTGRLPPRVRLGLVLFAALRFVLEEETQGRKAEQEGLEEPEAASGHVVDAFVTGGTQKKTQPVNECIMSFHTRCFCSWDDLMVLRELPAHLQGNKGLHSMDSEGSPPPAAETHHNSHSFPHKTTNLWSLLCLDGGIEHKPRMFPR